jgi:serine protease AprX
MKHSFTLIFVLPSFFIFLSAFILNGNPSWEDKVDAGVLAIARTGNTAAYLVILNEQADLSAAKLLHTKAEKGTFVFSRLRETAARTQAPLLRITQRFQAETQSFFVVNALHVKGKGEQLLRELATHSSVARIEPNPWVKMESPFPDETEAIEWRSGIEWGIQKIRADQVWALGYSGQGVVVGGQDTGYEWTHPSIRNQYRGWNGQTAEHPYNWHDAIREISPLHNDSTSSASNNPCGLNAQAPCDDNNHGTHTMGTMVGDDGQGNQIGVAPGARWIACRNMERGYGSPASYIECFEWFLAPTDLEGVNPDPEMAPHVINNSWGCPQMEGCNTSNWATMEMVVANLKAAGIVVVVSAGNSGSGCGSVRDPAAIFEPSFSVGATRSNDTIAGFSSRGAVTIDGSNRLKPNVAAPGVGVRSAVRNGSYAAFSGTSMAGPHVAGLVALLISANPELAGQVDLIEDIIERTAVPLFSNQNCGSFSGLEIPNAVYGFGRVDALAAVQDALQIVSASTDGLYNQKRFRIFPNPFSDGFILETAPVTGKVRMELFSMTGQMLMHWQWSGEGMRQEFIKLPELPSGLYNYRIVFPDGSSSGKLVKK